jgi:hypothetical protein
MFSLLIIFNEQIIDQFPFFLVLFLILSVYDLYEGDNERRSEKKYCFIRRS